jgi:hypothetical protein
LPGIEREIETHWSIARIAKIGFANTRIAVRELYRLAVLLRKLQKKQPPRPLDFVHFSSLADGSRSTLGLILWLCCTCSFLRVHCG